MRDAHGSRPRRRHRAVVRFPGLAYARTPHYLQLLRTRACNVTRHDAAHHCYRRAV